MAVGSFGFPDHLRQANIVGVAYGPGRCLELHATVPQITLIGRNRAHLASAFQEFNAWASTSDGEALAVTILFLRAGGYILALSPETSRLSRRCLGFDRAHRPLWVMPMWCKPIETVHPMLRALQEYCDGFPAPVLIGGAELRQGQVVAGVALDEIADLNPILKFALTMVDEADVEPNTPAWLALQMATPGAKKSGGKHSGHLPPSQVGSLRRRALRTHFPVTLERLRRSEGFLELCKVLSERGIQRWQVEQAICNARLSPKQTSARRKRGSANTVDPLVLSLQERYEVADGAELPPWVEDVVIRQIAADVRALLQQLGDKSRLSGAADGQARISVLGYLVAPSATLDGDDDASGGDL